MKLRAGRAAYVAACAVLLGFAGCGSEKSDEPPPAGALGDACNLVEATGCQQDLECTARGDMGVCTYPAGAACRPDDKALVNGGCSELALCKVPKAPAETDADADAGADAATPVCLTGEGGVCDPDAAHCDRGLTCAELESGEHKCFAPLVFHGQVSDSFTGTAIAAAHVIAIDSEGVAVSDVALSDAEGNYELEIPVLRNEDGSPVAATFTLRSAAQQYQPFPRGIRVALPISTTEASSDGTSYVVDNALTDVTLIPIEGTDLTMISGRVVALEGSDAEVGGVLVVAKGADRALSGVSDKSGAFTVFNVPAGDYELTGYAADIQIESESVSVADADAPVEDIELLEFDEATTTVSGKLEIVNAPGAPVTSVILVVEDTFDASAIRGEVPRGLRAPRTGVPNVDGEFSIAGVPAGRYVVLAAYENDDLVRDPSAIGGTELVSVEVSAGEGEVALDASFKVTEALEVLGPGVEEPQAVTSAPTLRWADDSSEEWYEVRVFNAFGEEVWSDLMVPSVSGSKEVSLDYAGPLDPGMYYQFRVSSWSQSGGSEPAALSTTEDLRGVFYMPGN